MFLRERAEMAGGILVLAAIGLASAVAIDHAGPLTWDEAVYACRSRSLVTEIPATGFAIYRPPGLPVLGAVAAPADWAAPSVRGLTLGAGLLAIAAMWALARSLFGQVAALVALVVVVGSPVVLTELRRFHNDLPAVGLLLLLMLVLWQQLECRPSPTKALLAAAPLAAAAFYVRYGTLPALAGIGIAAVILWAPRMRRSWKPVAATALVGAVLFAPHVVEAIARTGSPVGIVVSAADVAAYSTPIDSAWRYLTWLPVHLAGTGSLLFLASLLVALGGMFSHGGGWWHVHWSHRTIWLLLPAGVAWATLIVFSHPERRFALFSVILITIASSGVVVNWIGSWLQRAVGWRHQARILILAVVVICQFAAVGFLMRRQILAADQERATQGWVSEVGRVIGTDADGPCTVVTAIPPPIGWASRCLAVPFAQDPSAVLLPHANDPLYVVFTSEDTQRIRPSVLERYRRLQGSLLARIGDPGSTTAEIYRIGP